MKSAKRLGIVLTLALAGTVLAGALLSRCGRVLPATGATAVRNGALGALPRESVALLVLEVKALRAREPVAAWLRDAASGAGRQEALEQVRTRFGAQVIDRLERLSLAILPLEGVTMGWVVLAEGAFDEAAVREAIGGQEILTLFEVSGRPDLSVTVLKGGSLAFGPRAVLVGVRANTARRGSGLDANSALLDLLGKIRPDAAQLWGAVDYKPLARLARRAAESEGIRDLALSKAPGVESLVALTFQGSLDDTLRFVLTGRTDAETSAKTLADAARGLVALARMAAGQDSAKAWSEALEGIMIDQKGKEVTLHGAIALPTVAALAKMMKFAPPSAPVQAGAAAAPGPALLPGPARKPMPATPPAPTSPDPAPVPPDPTPAAPEPDAGPDAPAPEIPPAAPR
jgi:hypothetical protein